MRFDLAFLLLFSFVPHGMCSTPQIKLPTKSSLQHTLKLQTRAQNLNSYCVIVVVAIYSGSHGQRGSGCDGCCNRRGGCGSRGRMKEFSWNACWCVENEWKVHPIFLHTDKMERIASRLIFIVFPRRSSIGSRFGPAYSISSSIAVRLWTNCNHIDVSLSHRMDKYIATVMCGRLYKQ